MNSIVSPTILSQLLDVSISDTINAIERSNQALEAVNMYLCKHQQRQHQCFEEPNLVTLVKNNMAYVRAYNNATRDLAQALRKGWLSIYEIKSIQKVEKESLTDGIETRLDWMDLTSSGEQQQRITKADLQFLSFLDACRAEAVRLRKALLECVTKTASISETWKR